MARTTLSALQAAIAAAIEADAWFVDIPVIQDVGTQCNNEARERALSAVGICITVFPVEDFWRQGGSRGTNLVKASFFVWVEENPNRNQLAHNRSALEASARVVSIVTSYDSGPGELRPETDDRAGTLLISSDGVRVHELPFTKIVQLF